MPLSVMELSLIDSANKQEFSQGMNASKTINREEDSQ